MKVWLVVETGPGTKHPSREPGIGLARNKFILMSKAISQLGMVMHIDTWGAELGELAWGARWDLVLKTSHCRQSHEAFSGLRLLFLQNTNLAMYSIANFLPTAAHQKPR